MRISQLAICIGAASLLTGCDDAPEPSASQSAAAKPVKSVDDLPPVIEKSDALEQPEPMPQLLQQAIQLVSQGQLKPARDLAAHHLKRDPTEGRAEFIIALTYHNAGNHQPAVEHFERAIALSPEYLLARRYFGECLLMLGDLDGARAQYEAWSEVDPDEPVAPYGLGLVDLEAAMLDDAERRFREALALFERMKKADPIQYKARTAARARCHARLADVHFARDDYEAARDELLISTEIEPRNISAYYALSQVWRRLGDDAKADEALERYQTAKRAITGGDE